MGGGSPTQPTLSQISQASNVFMKKTKKLLTLWASLPCPRDSFSPLQMVLSSELSGRVRQCVDAALAMHGWSIPLVQYTGGTPLSSQLTSA